jgi:uncharacterized protein YoxC
MPEEQSTDQISFLLSDFNARLRDTEEKNRVLKERTVILGNNLISLKDQSDITLSSIKKDVSQIKKDVENIKNVLENLIGETNKLVRKEEVILIERMLKDFQPLEFARIKDIEDIIDKKLLSYKEDIKKEHPNTRGGNKELEKELAKVEKEVKDDEKQIQEITHEINPIIHNRNMRENHSDIHERINHLTSNINLDHINKSKKPKNL